MTVSSASQLLSVDEACDLVGSAAIALVEAVPPHWPYLDDLLEGQGSLRGLGVKGAGAVRHYRAVLRRVRALGLAWVIADQVEGALSYAGLGEVTSSGKAA